MTHEQIDAELAKRMPTASSEDRAELVRQLVSIAQQLHMQLQIMLDWIRFSNASSISPQEWRRWALRYRVTAEQLAALQREDDWHRLCPSCQSNSAHKFSGRWVCATCGEVQFPNS